MVSQNSHVPAVSRFRRGRLAAAATATAFLLGGASSASAAFPEPSTELPSLDRKGLLERSVEAHVSRERYEVVYAKARRLDVEPKRNLAQGTAPVPKLRIEAAVLNARVAGEQARLRIEEAAEPEFGTPKSVGVDSGTLEAIAACESGGDPAAVDPSGTYRGKYQFDLGTWAAVGGSGDPASAPEAEQDYRAALLLSQSGSSPWPVCG